MRQTALPPGPPADGSAQHAAPSGPTPPSSSTQPPGIAPAPGPAGPAPAVVAALLARGRDIERFAACLAAAGVLGMAASWTAAASHPRLLWALCGVAVVLMLPQKYWAMRVALDADLFRLGDAAAIDATLGALRLLPPHKAGRPWDARARGALRLLRRQAACVVVQWLVLAGGFATLRWPT